MCDRRMDHEGRLQNKRTTRGNDHGHKSGHKKLFMYAVLCLSLAVGLSSGVFSNYFKEVFAVDSVQRGLLEIPRETPGILCVVILTDHFNTVHTVMMKQLSLRPEDVMGNLSLGLSVDHVLAVTVSGGFGVIWKVWGPQYVFLLAAAYSAVHLAVAGYLEKSGIVKGG